MGNRIGGWGWISYIRVVSHTYKTTLWVIRRIWGRGEGIAVGIVVVAGVGIDAGMGAGIGMELRLGLWLGL